MALNTCVSILLCSLSTAARSAVRATFVSLQVGVNAQIASLTSAVALLQLTLVPMRVAAALAETTLAALDSAANVLSLQAEGCVDWGDIRTGVQDTITRPGTQGIRRILDDLNRAEDELAEVQAKLNEALTLKASIDEAIAVIDLCAPTSL